MMATPHLRSGVVAERSKPTSQEQWLHGCRSAEGSYSTFKVKKGDFVQGKRNLSETVGVARGHQRADTLKP